MVMKMVTIQGLAFVGLGALLGLVAATRETKIRPTFPW
jgi:hypothetical protein